MYGSVLWNSVTGFCSAGVQSVEMIVGIGSENTRRQDFTMCSRQEIEEYDDRVIMDINLACDTLMRGQKY